MYSTRCTQKVAINNKSTAKLDVRNALTHLVLRRVHHHWSTIRCEEKVLCMEIFRLKTLACDNGLKNGPKIITKKNLFKARLTPPPSLPWVTRQMLTPPLINTEVSCEFIELCRLQIK